MLALEVQYRVPALCAILCVLFLAGCGGGGSGSSAPGTPSTPSYSRDDARLADTNRALAQARTVARSLPNFGSVTQSTNRGVSGITTDAASTTFDGNNLTVAVSRQDGSTVRFNSATDALVTAPGTSPIPGHTSRGWGTLGYTNTSVTLGYAAVSWDNTDPTDYLAGGYWMHITGDLSTQRFTGAEIGAFIDGPELSGARSVPTLGTATYGGFSQGLYVSEHGSATDAPSGTVEVGEYRASLELTADFGSRTISGCIGCIGAVEVAGIAQTPNGEVFDFSNSIYARARLGTASINSGGTFRNSNVRVTIAGATASSTSGSWGGQFSNLPDSSGDPRLVAGTNGATWRGTDGTEVSFVGAFIGTTE